MKRILWIISAAIGFALLLAACAAPISPEKEEPVCGGVTDNTDPNAPKTIQSTEITSFECYFSTLTDMEREEDLGVGEYRLSAELKDGAAVGAYDFRDRYDNKDVKAELHADAGFFKELQAIVAKYDLAQFNGKSHFVAGLPEDFGATISVRYASDETIYAADNQDGFLPRGAMVELKQLFENACMIAPETVDLTVQEEVATDTVNGRFLMNRYPVLSPGCADCDGVVRAVNGSEGLLAALQAYNDEVRLRSADAYRDLHEMAKETPAGQEGDLSVETEVFVTRNDSTLVSFFEKTTQSGLLRKTYTTRARNIETASGEKLDWRDVFTDPESLPALLDTAFRSAYPDLRFNEDTEQLLREAIESGENLCFALSDGAACFVAAEYYLVPAWQELRVTLPYSAYPELVRADLCVSAPTRMTKMEYDTDYYADGMEVRMSYTPQGEYGDEIQWTLSVNGYTCSESFYPHEPTCTLIRASGKNYIYLNVPASDVSYLSYIYLLTPTGAQEIGAPKMCLLGTTNLNPERMQMAMDEFLYVDPHPLFPVGTFRVDENGRPIPVRDDYGLRGGEVELTNFASVPTVDLSDPNREGETANLPAGTRLSPFRTDRGSYIDYVTDDGVAVRFRIDKFAEDMEYLDFGKPLDIFKAAEYKD